MMAVNLRGPFLLCRAAVAQMLAQEPRGEARGRIVNITSQHGMVASPGDFAYAVGKGGLVQLTRQIAVEHGRGRIICNAVAPGKIVTGAPGDLTPTRTALAYVQSRTPFAPARRAGGRRRARWRSSPLTQATYISGVEPDGRRRLDGVFQRSAPRPRRLRPPPPMFALAGRRARRRQPRARLRGGRRDRSSRATRATTAGRVPRPRAAAAAPRPRHRAHFEYGAAPACGASRGSSTLGRAGDRRRRAAGAGAQSGGRGVDARARPRPARPRLALDRAVDAVARGGARAPAARDGDVRARARRAAARLELALVPSENTRELLVEEGGFLYDSDPSNDDLPYWTTVPSASRC